MWWLWGKLDWWFCTGRGGAEYLLMIWIVRSALCKLTQIPNNNIELKYYFRAQKYFQVRPGFAGSDMTPDGLDGSISGHHYYILFLHLLAEEPAGADTYFWLQELNVSLFCLVAAQTCPEPPSCWPEEAAEIKLPSLQCTRCWLVCHGGLLTCCGTWSSLSQVNEGLALPSFLVAIFFSVARSELRVKGVGNKLAETQFIHQDIILCAIFVLVFIYFIKRSVSPIFFTTTN